MQPLLLILHLFAADATDAPAPQSDEYALDSNVLPARYAEQWSSLEEFPAQPLSLKPGRGGPVGHTLRKAEPPLQRDDIVCPRAEPSRQPRRILLYCLQNSACTLFAFTLAQMPRTAVVPDLFNYMRTPCPDDFRQDASVDWIVVKMVVRTADKVNALQRLASIRSKLQPHLVLFFSRDPWANWASLSSKFFANDSGSIESKFEHWDVLFAQRATLANATFYLHQLCDPTGHLHIAHKLRALGVGAASGQTFRCWTQAPNMVLRRAQQLLASTARSGRPQLIFESGDMRGAAQVGDCVAKVREAWEAHSPGKNERLSSLAPTLSAFYQKLRQRAASGLIMNVSHRHPSLPACPKAPSTPRPRPLPPAPVSRYIGASHTISSLHARSSLSGRPPVGGASTSESASVAAARARAARARYAASHASAPVG
jgi:hypothetical protein